jgi:ketosteroid isomerase-like protein
MDIRSTLIELCDAFNAHDLDRIMSYFADNCVLEMPRGSEPWGTRYEGKAAAREGLAGRFAGIPDVRYTDETHYADESSQTGMSTWTLTGTTKDGELKRVRGCDFYTFSGGKVARKDSYWKIVEHPAL